jgi:intracellular sulfur oxidation DsrE/DsrF family protein
MKTLLLAAGLAAGLALAAAGPAGAADKVHRLALQISDESPEKMTTVLNNAANVSRYYTQKGEEVEVRIVAFNAGVNMMRTDKSPVLERLKTVTESLPNLTLEVCGNTLEGMAHRENKQVSEIPLFAGSKVVPAGVVELLELNEKGYTIIRP